MRIYEVKFSPMYPVGCCLIIAAEDIKHAREMAEKTITHTEIEDICEVDIATPKVVVYMSGDY